MIYHHYARGWFFYARSALLRSPPHHVTVHTHVHHIALRFGSTFYYVLLVYYYVLLPRSPHTVYVYFAVTAHTPLLVLVDFVYVCVWFLRSLRSLYGLVAGSPDLAVHVPSSLR